jgi:hypothetical protein
MLGDASKVLFHATERLETKVNMGFLIFTMTAEGLFYSGFYHRVDS